MYYHKLQSPADDWFFKLNKHDIITDEKFVVGDEIVVCKKCKACYKRSTWDALPTKACVGLGCGATGATLEYFTEEFFAINFGRRPPKKTFEPHAEQDKKTFVIREALESVQDNIHSDSNNGETGEIEVHEEKPSTFIVKNRTPAVAFTNDAVAGDAPLTFIIKQHNPTISTNTGNESMTPSSRENDSKTPAKFIVLYFVIATMLISGLSVGYSFLWNAVLDVNLIYRIVGIVSLVIGIAGGMCVCLIPFFKYQVRLHYGKYLKFLIFSYISIVAIFIVLFLLSWGMSACISIWSN